MGVGEIKQKALPVLMKYPIKRAGLFGSVVRGEDTDDSDIDILVDLDSEAGISLLDFIHIKHELEDTLGKNIDLVQYHLIKSSLKEYILPNEVLI